MTHVPAVRPFPLFAKAVAAASALLLCLGLSVGCASGSGQGDADGSSTVEAAGPLRVCSLKGPTTIGLASLVADAEGSEAAGSSANGSNGQAEGDALYDFAVVATADEVAAKLASAECDVALLPANLAATLYQRTDGAVRAIDVNTLGVLYALTADEALKGADDLSMADLAGRTVYLTGKGTVPQYTVECLLQAAGVADQVTLEFRSEPAEVAALVQADPSAVGILPQPFATAALAQDPALGSVLDLTEQWDRLFAGASDGQEPGRFVTGVTVARSEVLDQRPEDVRRFLRDHAASAALAVDDPAAVAPEVVRLGIVGSEAVAERAIPQCNVVCLVGDDMRSALSGYLGRLFELAPEALGGQLPDEAFYCVDIAAEAR